MITPIKAMTISQILERQDDLLVSTNDIKELAKNERVKVLDEIAEDFNEHLFDSPMMNPIMTRNEILLFLEQLKEQKGGAENG